MATLVLSTVGAAIGGSFGGTVLGLSGAAIGKAVGATIGAVIDQKILGSGSQVVETGKLSTFRLPGANEGAVVPRVMGRMRIAGQMIWSSHFKQHVTTTTTGGGGGGKATRPSQPKVTTTSYSYSISLAYALGAGEVSRVGRVWADGQELDRNTLSMAFYPGNETQMPDPTIVSIEGAENTPYYRGTSYVVLEDLDLEPFGNRIPQFNFEVFRRAQPEHPTQDDPAKLIKGVCMIPGSGEYSLATTPVHFQGAYGQSYSANVNTGRGQTDFTHALEDLAEELPEVGSVSLVVSWYGDNLKCGACQLRPKVDRKDLDGTPIPWVVSGVNRANAPLVSTVNGRAAFGGTVADAAVLEGIAKLRAEGQNVVFYPFIQMDIQADNGLGDPWSANADQPIVPWRGRITTSKAPGQPGSPDKTAAAAAEVNAFFGTAQPGDFSVSGGVVSYAGPAEWSYRRFILHYAHLCVAAGGVDAFNIGSEMRGLTQIRDGQTSFPAVAALQQLAMDVRSVLGAGTKIGYAADWSEYFGYHPQDGSNDLFFHLDPLWAQGEIDYVGIDNYMPLADWRDDLGHADEAYGSVYDLEYLRSNVAGGEGYHWYYGDQLDRDTQNRRPITDGAYDEPWVFRYKDLVNWWDREHYNRIGGVREAAPTSWSPRSKPIYFTELGCPAVDKGANQPNVFSDPKSSENALPYYSNGGPDDYMQAQYIKAMYGYWNDPANNPTSDKYIGQMVDMTQAHVWAWDARPWPAFPDRTDVWTDGGNHARGHWLTGRFGAQTLAAIVSEVCDQSGLVDIDVSGLYGQTRGFAIQAIETGRQSLQPLMMAFDFSTYEVDGVLVFRNRNARVEHVAKTPDLVVDDDADAVLSKTRAPEAEMVGRVRVSFWDDAREYQTGTSEFVLSDDLLPTTTGIEMPLVLTPGEASNLARKWLAQSRVSRDEVAFALPPSVLNVTPGDVVRVEDGGRDAVYRVERIEEQGLRRVEATRVEQEVYKEADASEIASAPIVRPVPALPVFSRVLDLPLVVPGQDVSAPFVAAAAQPWPTGAAVYTSASEDGFTLNTVVDQPAVVGETLSALTAHPPSVWSPQSVEVRLSRNTLQSRTRLEVLNGANAMAIGSEAEGWEIIQFAQATLTSEGTYILRDLLRGQAGSEAVMPDSWAAGRDVILIDSSLEQVVLGDAFRGIAQNYRIGPVGRVSADASFTQSSHTFNSVAQIPFAPVHLRVKPMDGTWHGSWIRRSRIDGDNWQAFEVPVGETNEQFRVRFGDDTGVLHEEVVTQASAIYPDTLPAPGVGAYMEVAQISEKVGPGYAARTSFVA